MGGHVVPFGFSPCLWNNTEKQTEPETVLEPSQIAQLKFRTQVPEIEESVVGEGELYPETETTYRNKNDEDCSCQTSMERVSGHSWEVNGRDKWDDYSDTLGVVISWFERRTISVMFWKFWTVRHILVQNGFSKIMNEKNVLSEINDGLFDVVAGVFAHVFTVR